MNKQQQAIALLINLLCARPQRRKELMKQQHSFTAVIRGEEVVVAHGEFFVEGDIPFHEVGKTTEGVCFRNLLTGSMAFVPFDLAPVAPAPVAAPVAAPAVPVVKVVSTLSRRVHFGEITEIRDALFQLVETFVAPSSGAVIEQLFDDGSMTIRFIGSIEKTWTI